MSTISCDYQAEARAAMDMADTASSEIEQFEWLFLALAWQALARCRDAEALRQDTSASTGAENQPAP